MKPKNNQKTSAPMRRAVIYVRYIFPMVAIFVCLLTLLVPCLSYSTVQGTQDAISSAELIGNSWDQVRAYIFATANQEPSQLTFAKTVFALVIVLVALFVIGSASCIVCAFFALRYLIRSERDVAHTWFVTIVPNRIAVCALQALTLPLLFFSRMIIPLYEGMGVRVLLNVKAPEAWVWGLILYAVSLVLSVVSARQEKRLGLDAFAKRRVSDNSHKVYEEAYSSTLDVDSEREDYEMIRRSKEEQAERIRALLHLDDEDKE